MSKGKKFETEKYEFWFYQEEKIVVVDVATVERRPFTDKDVSELEKFFGDMGKWEAFVKAGKSLLEDLGIIPKGKKEHEKDFGFEKYQVYFKKKDDRVVVTIDLTSRELLKRTRKVLPVEEIMEQVKNASKWRTLKKTMLELKEKK